MHRVSRCFRLIAFLAGLFSTALLAANEPVNVRWSDWKDVDGRPLTVADAKWKVVCFVGSECPLARLYGPRLDALGQEFAGRGVQLVGINGNPQDSPADVRRYIEEQRVSFPIVKDPEQKLVKIFGAKRTPEVFVLDEANHVRYRGRIDDQYEPGTARPAPTRHDLRLAIEALLAGQAVPNEQTTAVGCLITMIPRSHRAVDPAEVVTFTRDVAPILNRHCVECHRAGEIGPFALTDYEEVVGWGEMMLEVVDQKRMPPWHADPRYGKFVGERHFPAEDRATLAAWVAQGMPQGDVKELPPQPTWAGGWQLPTFPDVEIAMRDRPFVVPADGVVDYQYFVVDPQWKEDRWVRAAQVIPGNSSVVHHTIIFVRPPDGSRAEGTGWLGGYVPGQRTGSLPPGHARRIPANSKLVFQMHYTPNGRETPDVTKVGIWFAKADEVTHEVTTRVALNHHFEIPPGAKNFLVDLQLEGFSGESRLLGMTPHMHLRGKSFRLEVQKGTQRETLLSVPQYDFNWQHWYQLETPLDLADIDALQMQVGFDNSAENPTNPDPRDYVTWGDQTWQEMAVAFFDVAHPRGQKRIAARSSEKKGDDEARERRIREQVEKFLSQMDRDGDGIVTREESPEAFRRFGFRKFDHDGNGRIERGEIEAEAARRL